jgi:hypothetical protein
MVSMACEMEYLTAAYSENLTHIHVFTLRQGDTPVWSLPHASDVYKWQIRKCFTRNFRFSQRCHGRKWGKKAKKQINEQEAGWEGCSTFIIISFMHGIYTYSYSVVTVHDAYNAICNIKSTLFCFYIVLSEVCVRKWTVGVGSRSKKLSIWAECPV